MESEILKDLRAGADYAKSRGKLVSYTQSTSSSFGTVCLVHADDNRSPESRLLDKDKRIPFSKFPMLLRQVV